MFIHTADLTTSAGWNRFVRQSGYRVEGFYFMTPCKPAGWSAVAGGPNGITPVVVHCHDRPPQPRVSVVMPVHGDQPDSPTLPNTLRRWSSRPTRVAPRN